MLQAIRQQFQSRFSRPLSSSFCILKVNKKKILSNPAGWQQLASAPAAEGGLFGVTRLLLVIAGLTLESLIGGLLLAAAILLIIGRLRWGLMLGYWGFFVIAPVTSIPDPGLLTNIPSISACFVYNVMYKAIEYPVRSNSWVRRFASKFIFANSRTSR